MSFQLRHNPIFEADRGRFLKNRPLAKGDVEQAIKFIQANPKAGDFYVGTSPETYKLRWALKSYNIGARGGLRIVYVVKEAVRIILPLTLWQKKDFQRERDAVAHVKQRFKDTIVALKATGHLNS